MEQKFFDAVFEVMTPSLEENGFTFADGVYKSETHAFKVEHNAERNVFELHAAAVTDGDVGEYTVASSYLFDEKYALFPSVDTPK